MDGTLQLSCDNIIDMYVYLQWNYLILFKVRKIIEK